MVCDCVSGRGVCVLVLHDGARASARAHTEEVTCDWSCCFFLFLTRAGNVKANLVLRLMVERSFALSAKCLFLF